MGLCGRELIAADESTFVSKSLLDVVVVKDGQGDGRFPDPPWTNESNWGEVVCITNYPLDQAITTKAGPWWRGREFSRRGAEQKSD